MQVATTSDLKSLAPEYDQSSHGTYVARLNTAVADVRNRNIALTGRYGAGKSSILDQFAKEQSAAPESSKKKWWANSKPDAESPSGPKKMLRISINTLGPDDGEDLTNRIQKELVKQLVYRAAPGEVRTSRFARAKELTRSRAALEAAGAAIALVGVLWLFNLRPEKNSFGTDNLWLPMAVLLFLAFAVFWSARWYLGRRRISQFSTSGASIAFEENTESYFDQYLDELVAFFEATEPDIVIFEDLDRFDDARIFDSLRELNTLVNASSHWAARSNRPLRFVYAIKDSLFEKLGEQQQVKDDAAHDEADSSAEAQPRAQLSSLVPASLGSDEVATAVSDLAVQKKDSAKAAVERANRTKFFEIVIPVVPFLSHANSRDLLVEEASRLKVLSGMPLDRGLIDIVARYTTDMRLMINICNEFEVFAERLLSVEAKRRAPGLTPDLLFALVVYKNFHLADFESMPHRGSALDALEQSRRGLVKDTTDALQRERSEILSGARMRADQSSLAETLGRRLALFLKSSQVAISSVRVGETALNPAAIDEPSFWQPIALAGRVQLSLRHLGNQAAVTEMNRADLELLFPEAASASAWTLSASDHGRERVAQIDDQDATLRGVSFADLIDDHRYVLGGRSFADIAKSTLPSDLAYDLVARGYIDRYFAEYSSVFYGNFLGVDVANFFRNSVQPNETDTHFHFSTDGAIGNVLEQAPADFLQSRAALNIEIVDYLLATRSRDLAGFLDYLTRPGNDEAARFLTAYLNTPKAQRMALVASLAAKPWPQLFSFLADTNVIPDDETRAEMFSTAIANSSAVGDFDLDESARSTLARLYSRIPAFTHDVDPASTETVYSFLSSPQPAVPNLSELSEALRVLAVEDAHYQLDAENLRTAASLSSNAPVCADNLIKNNAVWQNCANRIDEFLSIVEADVHTQTACESAVVASSILNAQFDRWSAEQLAAFLSACSETSSLADIALVPVDIWPALATSRRMRLSVANVSKYVNENGVDGAISTCLIDDNGAAVALTDVDTEDEEVRETLALEMLNAAATLSADARVELANQLVGGPGHPMLALSDITATADGLFAEMLRVGMVEDSVEAFEHFAGAGEPALRPALARSENAATFITPELVDGFEVAVVNDRSIPLATRRSLLEQVLKLAVFVPDELQPRLAATARELGVLLTADQLLEIASQRGTAENILWQLNESRAALTDSEVISILREIPGDFAGFAGSAGTTFDVPDSLSLSAVLDRLRVAGLIGFPVGRPAGRRKVRIE